MFVTRFPRALRRLSPGLLGLVLAACAALPPPPPPLPATQTPPEPEAPVPEPAPAAVPEPAPAPAAQEAPPADGRTWVRQTVHALFSSGREGAARHQESASVWNRFTVSRGRVSLDSRYESRFPETRPDLTFWTGRADWVLKTRSLEVPLDLRVGPTALRQEWSVPLNRENQPDTLLSRALQEVLASQPLNTGWARVAEVKAADERLVLVIEVARDGL